MADPFLRPAGCNFLAKRVGPSTMRLQNVKIYLLGDIAQAVANEPTNFDANGLLLEQRRPGLRESTSSNAPELIPDPGTAAKSHCYAAAVPAQQSAKFICLSAKTGPASLLPYFGLVALTSLLIHGKLCNEFRNICKLHDRGAHPEWSAESSV